MARGGHLASIHSSEDFQEIHEAAERAYVMNALFIGAYEPSEGRWEWTDGTAWDEREISQISNGALRNNWDGNNEDEMAYCRMICLALRPLAGNSDPPDSSCRQLCMLARPRRR